MDKTIGIENILKQLARYNHSGLAVFTIRGNEEVFRRYQLDGESMEDVNNAFIDWLEDLEENNPTSFVGYKIQLYEYPEGAKKRKGCGVISFQLNETPNKEHFKPGKPLAGTGEYVHAETMRYAIENANLKNQNEQLQQRLETIEMKMRQLDNEEEEEEEENEYIGAVHEVLRDKLPIFIDAFVGMLMKPEQQQQTAISGIDSVSELINEFKTINPNIESDLKKLLQLAKTKPKFFNMLIQQLRAM